MLRSALVALDGSAYSESRGRSRHRLGLSVWCPPARSRYRSTRPSIQRAEPVPLGAGAFKKARDEARLADAHRRVADFLADFRARGHAAGVAVEVLEDIGDPPARILREAQRCDVVILARETHFHFETQERPDETLARVLRGSPRPVVDRSPLGSRRDRASSWPTEAVERPRARSRPSSSSGSPPARPSRS